MKTKILLYLKKLPLPFFVLTMAVTVCSSCNVVVPKFEATSFISNSGTNWNMPGTYDIEETYSVSGKSCKSDLYPNQILPTEESTPSAAFINAVKVKYPGWTFNTNATSLGKKAIEIKTYDVVGTPTKVGVEIHARYVPQTGDPTDSIHWLQVLTTNHGLKGTGHGPIVTYHDNASTATSPYYDNGYVGNSRNIYDLPNRPDAASDHTWQATTFVVSGPPPGTANGTVTIYVPGYTWGFTNTCVTADGIQDEFVIATEKAEIIPLAKSLNPGDTLVLNSQAASSMVLEKGKTKVPLKMLSRQLAFTVGKQTGSHPYSELSNAHGTISFADYSFEDKKITSASAKIVRGSGMIDWESGDASIEFVAAINLPNGKTEEVVFTGTAFYDKKLRSFRINDLKGVRTAFAKLSIPKEKKNKDER